MDKNTHIVSLVRKLLDDNLSVDELNELQQLFRHAQAKGEVEKWLNEVWELAEQQDSCSVHATYILDRLREKLQFPQTAPSTLKNDEDPAIIRIVRSLMRYAAVFLLAMVFSWYQFGKNKPPEIQPSDTNESFGVSEVSVTYGSKTRIVLPDSSVVFLNSGSQLSCPPVFGSERYVTLIGEGYFVVRSDSLHPFFVHTADVSVKAMGTEFNVKAYPEEKSVETVLVRGSVEILKKGQKKPIIELKPGERAAYVKVEAATEQEQSSANVAASKSVEKEKRQMVVGIDKKPDVTTGWVTNNLVFDAEPFEQIAVRLERWFNVEIEIRNAKLSKTHLTGRYDTENIEQVMQSLQMVTHFTYRIEKNKIIIK